METSFASQQTPQKVPTSDLRRRTRLDYRTVWRWHFYAGLLCIPFILWLATTGSIYLFRPQIERWLDRPYDNLSLQGRASASDQVQAALAAVPGSSLHHYQLPRTSRSATQIIVGRGTDEFRVYVHPESLQILRVINEDHRLMMIVFHLHGELLLGDWGSMIIELAGSWAVIMILTGLYLWWPRQSAGFAGVLYPRLFRGKRIFWRDIHAVTGIWISFFALFLLFTGLPWASSWGRYLGVVRKLTRTEASQKEWTTGRSSELAQRSALNAPRPEHAHGPHGGHVGHSGSAAAPVSQLSALDEMIATVVPLNLAYPVRISPPTAPDRFWTACSDSQNRTLHDKVFLDPVTGAMTGRENFSQQIWIDRWIETGVAAHEGQLFGVLNQLLGLMTTLGLITLSISAIVLWWRRRPKATLGVPAPLHRLRFTFGLIVTIIGLGVYLPSFGLSLISIALLERLVLRRWTAAQTLLGLQPVSE